MEKEKAPRKKKKNTSYMIFSSLLSLIVTFLLIWSLLLDIEAFTQGDSSGNRIILTVLKSIGLLIIPFIFNPKAVMKRLGRHQEKIDRRKKDALDLQIAKMVRFNAKFSPSLVVKCPKCKFDNPTKTKICFNCGHNINF